MKSIFKKAIDFFQKQFCFAVIPGIFLFFFCFSLKAEDTNSSALSISGYQDKLKRDGGDLLTCLDLAALYKEQGLYKRAIEVLNQGLDSAGSRQEKDTVRFFLAEIFFLQGENDLALEILRKKFSGRDKDWLLPLYRGLSHEAKHNLFLAEKNYRQSLDRKKNSIALYRLAKIYYSRRKFKSAARYFKETIDFDSSIRTAYVYLGQALLKSGDNEQAYKYLAKALNFYPQQQQVKADLAKVKKKLGKKFFAVKKKSLDKKRKEKKFGPYTPALKEVPLVKVRIIENAAQLTLKCGGDFIFQGKNNKLKAKKNKFYRVCYKSKKGVDIFEQKTGRKLCSLATPLVIKNGKFPFYLLDVSMGKGDFWQKKIDSAYKGDLIVSAAEGNLQVVNELDVETYLYGVIAAEIFSSSPAEALKAQAVAARTLSMKNRGRHKNDGFDFCNTTHCQVYRGLTVETAATTEAVDQTRGEVMFYDDEPIEAFYHSNCGGCLRRDLYGSPPYLFSGKRDLRGKEWDSSPWGQEKWFKQDEPGYCNPSQRNNYRWQRVYDAEDFLLDFGFALDKLKSLVPEEKGDCGHIQKLKVVTDKGTELIEKDINVRNFLGKIKSSACSLELKFKKTKKESKPDMLFIWGAGFGHGLGMCQEGTISQAEQGFSYRDILTHYYKDIEIKRAY